MPPNRLIAVVLCSLAGTIGGSRTSAAYPGSEQSQREVEKRLVAIRVWQKGTAEGAPADGCGTGVIVTPSHVITAFHVLHPEGMDVGRIEIRSPLGESLWVSEANVSPTRRDKENPNADFALITLNEPLPHIRATTDIFARERQADLPDEGLIIGRRCGDEPLTVLEDIPKREGEQWRANSTALGIGYSGSPVLSLRHNRVVAIYTGVNREEGFAYVMPLASDYVQGLLEREKIQLPYVTAYFGQWERRKWALSLDVASQIGWRAGAGWQAVGRLGFSSELGLSAEHDGAIGIDLGLNAGRLFDLRQRFLSPADGTVLSEDRSDIWTVSVDAAVLVGVSRLGRIPLEGSLGFRVGAFLKSAPGGAQNQVLAVGSFARMRVGVGPNVYFPLTLGLDSIPPFNYQYSGFGTNSSRTGPTVSITAAGGIGVRYF